MKYRTMAACLMLSAVMAAAPAAQVFAEAAEQEEAAAETEAVEEKAAETEAAEEAAAETADEAAAAEEAIEVVPVVWQPSPEHPLIDTDEARELYASIKNGEYPSLEELLANPVVQQLDALSAYYKAMYGNTAEIDTPERDLLRETIKDEFLKIGSAVAIHDDTADRYYYEYDGELDKGYQMELVLGLPASGKSTRVSDPDSDEMNAFILDVDVIKAMIPEYRGSYGAGSDAIHFEGMLIFDEAIKEFLEGDLRGTNVILPIVASDFDELFTNYIEPFEAAGYDVRAKFCDSEPNESAARVVMRELGDGGQLINSAVVTSFGSEPEEVYNQLAPMINAKGNTYGYDVESTIVQFPVANENPEETEEAAEAAEAEETEALEDAA